MWWRWYFLWRELGPQKTLHILRFSTIYIAQKTICFSFVVSRNTCNIDCLKATIMSWFDLHSIKNKYNGYAKINMTIYDGKCNQLIVGIMIIIHSPSSLISWGKFYLVLKESLINSMNFVLGLNVIFFISPETLQLCMH